MFSILVISGKRVEFDPLQASNKVKSLIIYVIYVLGSTKMSLKINILFLPLEA